MELKVNLSKLIDNRNNIIKLYINFYSNYFKKYILYFRVKIILKKYLFYLRYISKMIKYIGE